MRVFSGIYVRVKRDNEWRNLNIFELSPEELDEVFKGRSAEELIRWIKAILKVIQELEA